MKTARNSRAELIALACVRHFFDSAERRYLPKIREGGESRFTRRRKTSVRSLLAQMVLRKGATQFAEVRSISRAFPELRGITESGFFRARAKMGSLFLRDALRDFYLSATRAMPGRRGFKGFAVYAVDGSSVVLRSDMADASKYGIAENGRETRPFLAGLSTVFDCANGLVADATVAEYPLDEHAEAWSGAKRLISMRVGPFVLVGDRNYFSFPLASLLDTTGNRFLFRLRKTDLKKERAEMAAAGESDSWFLTRPCHVSVNNYYKGAYGPERYGEVFGRSYWVRIVDVAIANADGEMEVETLVTNLDEAEATPEELRSLYWMRWGEETAYRYEKSTLKMEQWTGRRETGFLQDLYGSVICFDIALLLSAAARAAYRSPKRIGKYEVKANMNRCVGLVKGRLAEELWGGARKGKEKGPPLLLDLSRQHTPIRPDRNWPRAKKSNKSRMSYTYTY